MYPIRRNWIGVTAASAALLLAAVGGIAAVTLPASAATVAVTSTPASDGSSATDPEANEVPGQETADDQGIEDGANDGETADDQGIEDGTNDGETADDVPAPAG